MKLKVTNWRRWQRTKGIAGAVCFIIALGCAGGLESEGAEPIPSVEGFVIFLSLSMALMLNVTKHMRRREQI